jgi:hypothetical protein
MKSPMTLLIEDLIYLKQLNEGDRDYIQAIDDVITRIDIHFKSIEREHIGDAYEAGNRVYSSTPSVDIKGTHYYDKKYN